MVVFLFSDEAPIYVFMRVGTPVELVTQVLVANSGDLTQGQGVALVSTVWAYTFQQWPPKMLDNIGDEREQITKIFGSLVQAHFFFDDGGASIVAPTMMSKLDSGGRWWRLTVMATTANSLTIFGFY